MNDNTDVEVDLQMQNILNEKLLKRHGKLSQWFSYVLNSPVKFKRGQEAVVTYTIIQSVPNKNNQDLLVDSLIGAIPNNGKSLSEYRSERLRKYASID